MTLSGDFLPTENQDFDSEPAYPTVFGFELTPQVSGILIGILGLAGAIYLFANVVQPALQRNDELRADIAAKEAQIQNQAETLQEIEDIEAKLAETQEKRAQVYSLFADAETINTLLLDINQQIEETNAGLDGLRVSAAALVEEPVIVQARLKKFTPMPDGSGVITDGSLGAAVNGKLQRQLVAVELEGSFEQTQAIIRNIERLQPLLIMKDFKIMGESVDETRVVQGRVVIQPKAKLTTSFGLEALSPTSSVDELPDVTPPAAEGEGEEASAGEEAAG
ncbi:MAG: hypothetical protein F6K19_01325 [Cyanothece sp. SIO1E1]|nr:hypothetical protein [Cyanothece sp. SIO1E1]